MVARPLWPAAGSEPGNAGALVQAVLVVSPAGPTALAGTLSLPAGAGPFAAVLLLDDAEPGQTAATTGLITELASYLVQQNVAVLHLDARGQGSSGGALATASPADLATDARAALSMLRSRPGIDPLRVGMLGHGHGADVALLAASQTPAPAFVVAVAASGVSGQEQLARQWNLVNQPGEPDTARAALARHAMQVLTLANRYVQKQLKEGASPAQTEIYLAQQRLRLQSEEKKRLDALTKRQRAMLEIVRQTADNAQAQTIVANMLRQQYPAMTPAQAQARAAQLATPWTRHLLGFDPQATLAQVSCPLLLLQGAADVAVPAEDNLPALKKALHAHRALTVHELPGLDHHLAPARNYATSAPDEEAAPTASTALALIRDWVRLQAQGGVAAK